MDETSMMLGRDWEWQNVIGWFASEKLWDVRLYWDGQNFWTRGGNLVAAPDWFKAGLPACELDGGLFIPGKTTDRAATDAVNFGRFPDNARFAIYDAPEMSGNKSQRLSAIAGDIFAAHAFIIETRKISSLQQMAEWVERILRRGGEGLMLTHPRSRYERRRTPNLLKLKSVPHEYLFV